MTPEQQEMVDTIVSVMSTESSIAKDMLANCGKKMPLCVLSDLDNPIGLAIRVLFVIASRQRCDCDNFFGFS